jgi:hypothetical protein
VNRKLEGLPAFLTQGSLEFFKVVVPWRENMWQSSCSVLLQDVVLCFEPCAASSNRKFLYVFCYSNYFRIQDCFFFFNILISSAVSSSPVVPGSPSPARSARATAAYARASSLEDFEVTIGNLARFLETVWENLEIRIENLYLRFQYTCPRTKKTVTVLLVVPSLVYSRLLPSAAPSDDKRTEKLIRLDKGLRVHLTWEPAGQVLPDLAESIRRAQAAPPVLVVDPRANDCLEIRLQSAAAHLPTMDLRALLSRARFSLYPELVPALYDLLDGFLRPRPPPAARIPTSSSATATSLSPAPKDVSVPVPSLHIVPPPNAPPAGTVPPSTLFHTDIVFAHCFCLLA